MSVEEKNAGNFVQVVSAEGEFISTEHELKELMSRNPHKGGASGSQYAIVGIMGCQSSGKSTLLNRLFGTQFYEMDAAKGRQQTTLGVWLDTAENTNDIMVLDLEGADSSERGEDRESFERQSALFALALSEVLIINIWEHDIGRYVGSNFGIMQTIFEVNLELFYQENKTLLLFVIRDHDEGETPFKSIQKKIEKEVKGVWSKVRKPKKFAKRPLSDVCDIKFAFLPHKKHQAKEFEKGVAELRSRFMDKSAKGYFFNTKYHFEKSVPIDGFAHYIKTLWDTIRSSKDLNIPSQKAMLSTFRCDEIADLSFEKYLESVKDLRLEAKSNLVPEFGARVKQAFAVAFEEYDKPASRYLEEVAQRKRLDLKGKISDDLYKIFLNQVNLATAQALEKLAHIFAERFPSRDDEVAFDFGEVCEAGRAAATKFFIEMLQSFVPDEVKWPLDELETHFVEEMEERISLEREKQIKKLPRHAEKEMQTLLKPPASAILTKAENNFWHSLAELHAKVEIHLEEMAEKAFVGFEAPMSERVAVKKEISASARSLLLEICQSHAKLVVNKMRTRFDNEFRYDENKIPRRWEPNVDIRKIYAAARNDALLLVELFASFQLDAPSYRDNILRSVSTPDLGEQKEHGVSKLLRDEEGPQLLTELECDNFRHQFERDAESALREAEAMQERLRSQQKLPMWAMVVIGVLAYQPVMGLLHSKFLFIIVLFLVVAAVAIQAAGLTGPVLFILKGILKNAMEYANASLNSRPPVHSTEGAAEDSKKDR